MVFFLPENHLALLQDRFLKKKAFEKSKNLLGCFTKTRGSNNSFILIKKKKKIGFFKIVKFEFKVTIHYGLQKKASSRDPLKALNVHTQFPVYKETSKVCYLAEV